MATMGATDDTSGVRAEPRKVDIRLLGKGPRCGNGLLSHLGDEMDPGHLAVKNEVSLSLGGSRRVAQDP